MFTTRAKQRGNKGFHDHKQTRWQRETLQRADQAARLEKARQHQHQARQEELLREQWRQQGQAVQHERGFLTGANKAMLAQCDRIFDHVDRNRDGQLTRAEVIKGLRSSDELRGLLDLDFAQDDINLQLGNKFHQSFERVFQSMDANSDRAVSRNEFKEHCIKYPAKVTPRSFAR